MKVNLVQNINTISNAYKKQIHKTEKVEKKDTVDISITKFDVIKKKIEDGYYFTDEFNNLLADKLMKDIFNSEYKNE